MHACAVCGHEAAVVFKFCPECGTPAAPGSQEQRKTVTVLFCDVVGSTALGESTDPEALRALLARYFERMNGVLERHGGTVEKFIGDAVMAIFGVPLAHEDDALRACRAAVEMREALPALGLEGRIGISTGEVVTGTQERLATGDPVNVAARLQQAGEPGEVLLGEATLALVDGAVEVEAVEPLQLKGKSKPVPAFRLLSAQEAVERRHDARFVGREQELALIRAAWERALAEQRCELVTIVGEAGVGKSRLVSEALASVEACIVHGRCLPYGTGITYWPVVEVIRQLEVLPSDPAAASALGSLLGESKARTSAEEIAWAFRKLLEEAAPLVCVFDDIQWGEEIFFDLVEHLALLSSGSRMLVVCIARPELVERRPAWPLTLRLEPLADKEVDELISSRVSSQLREGVARAAGGNPLFVAEMLAMAEQADGEVAVPPTLRALLAARLDQLEAPERRVLERGAVEGELFHRGAVQALAPEETQVTPRLAALVRKELVHPDKAQLPGEDGFRFSHLLMRDAAYDGVPKSARAELHERFAAWLEERGQGLVELDEITGYHLERAYHYQAELAGVDGTAEALGRRAAARLGAAGSRALRRKDAQAGISLISRAVALLPSHDATRVNLVPTVRALQETGADLAWAHAVLEEAIAAGDERTKAHALVQRAFLRLFTEPELTPAELFEVSESAIDLFEQIPDELGLARAWRLIAQAHYLARRAGACAEASEHGLDHARHAGDRFEQREIVEWLLVALFSGPAPAPQATRRCQQLLDELGGDQILEVPILAALAFLWAMQGRMSKAEELLARGRRAMDELGEQMWQLFICSAFVAFLRGDPRAAERELRHLYDAPTKIGERSVLTNLLAAAVYKQGRFAEAERLARECEEASRANDVGSQIGWRATRAKVLARRGELKAAEELAQEAVAFGATSDFLNIHADALIDLAEVVQLAGRSGDAVSPIEEAIRLYERKRNVVMAGQARARLGGLTTAASPT